MTFEISADGIPIYHETFPNGLYEFYNGVRGYIYTCDTDFEVDDRTAIKCAVVSKKPVPIKDTDIVENAYERIQQYEQQGLLHINHYDGLSNAQILRDKKMVIGAIQNLRLQKKNIHYRVL